MRSALRLVFGRAHRLDDVVAQPEASVTQPLQERSYAVDAPGVSRDLEQADRPNDAESQPRSVAPRAAVVEAQPVDALGEGERNRLALAGTEPVWDRINSGLCGVDEPKLARLDGPTDGRSARSVGPPLRRLSEDGGRHERGAEQLRKQVQ